MDALNSVYCFDISVLCVGKLGVLKEDSKRMNNSTVIDNVFLSSFHLPLNKPPPMAVEENLTINFFREDHILLNMHADEIIQTSFFL